MRTFYRSLRVLLASLVIGYSVVLAMMMYFERGLVYPVPDASLADWNPVDLKFQDVWIEADDGTRLHGWYLPHDDSPVSAVYFHGNGEDVSTCGLRMDQWRDALGASVLVMDYRGYGKSQGKPIERALVADGVRAVQWLAEREQTSADDIVLWGRSIGGGVAAGVAEVTKPRAIVMETTFDSLVDVAALHITWIPVRWLMRNRFPSAKRLSNYDGEYIQWHGDADEIVPLDSAKRLYDAIPSTTKRFIVGKRHGHNDESPAEFNDQVQALFKRLAAKSD